MRRIIFINRFFYPDLSATSQLLSDLAFHFAARGLEVLVVTSSQSYDDPSVTFATRELVNGVDIKRIRTTRFGRAQLWLRMTDYLTFYLGAAWYLLKVVNSEDIVVAKTDPPLISVLAGGVAKWRGATLVNWIQDLFPEIAESLGVLKLRSVGRILRSLRNGSLRRAQRNVVLGTRMEQRLIAPAVPRDKIRVIHNWADGQEIRPIDRDANELIDHWGLRKRFVVGYSGNMGRAHEFATILEAAELLSGMEDIVFLFIGNGPQRQWIVHQAERRSLKNVVFRPYQPRALLRLSLGVPHVHLISLFPALEGLIVPSKFYGIAAAGRPTIFVGDPEGEVARILREEQCGWSVAVGQRMELALRIAHLAGNPAQAGEMGDRAREAFERRFDKVLAFERWEQVLTETGLA